MKKATLWPLLVDPHGLATTWIKKLYKDKGLMSQMLSEKDFLPMLETAVEMGLPFLIERVPEKLPNDLDPIFFKQAYRTSGSIHQKIKLDEREIEWNENFRLFIATELHDPHFLPTVSTKVCILDFSVTPAGMEETLLNIVLLHEHPTLEEERIEVQVQVVENQEQLKETEAHILKVMSESMGNILDDENAIAVLRESQKIAKTVAAKQELAKSLESKHESLRAFGIYIYLQELI